MKHSEKTPGLQNRTRVIQHAGGCKTGHSEGTEPQGAVAPLTSATSSGQRETDSTVHVLPVEQSKRHRYQKLHSPHPGWPERGPCAAVATHVLARQGHIFVRCRSRTSILSAEESKRRWQAWQGWWLYCALQFFFSRHRMGSLHTLLCNHLTQPMRYNPYLTDECPRSQRK